MKRHYLTAEDLALSNTLLAERYGVHYRTISPARKRGWLVPAYKQRVVDVDTAWITEHGDEIYRCARMGAFRYLKPYWQPYEKWIAPFEIDDLIGEGVLRLCELSGHQDIESEIWRIHVARRAVGTFLRSQVRKHEDKKARATA